MLKQTMVGAALIVSTPALAEHETYANVLDVEPIVRVVTVETPIRECYEETVYEEERSDGHNGRGVAGPMIAGGLIGGLVGSQFGDGSGRELAIAAGAVIGSAVAHDRAIRRRQEPAVYTTYSRPVTRCDTRYETHEEERIDGYRVRYEYAGQVYTTRLGHDPGERMRVRVAVRPAE